MSVFSWTNQFLSTKDFAAQGNQFTILRKKQYNSAALTTNYFSLNTEQLGDVPPKSTGTWRNWQTRMT
jgi:hypothetical protein